MLEYKTYRYPGHSRGDPGNYRDAHEVEQWRRRDPIAHCRSLLASEFRVGADILEEIDRRCQATVEAAVRSAIEGPEPEGRAVLEHVFAPPGTAR